MGVKEYEMSNGRKVVFEFDENGVGNITLEAMDLLMGMVNIDLVRCGECKYGTKIVTTGKITCNLDRQVWEKTDFCSYGERNSKITQMGFEKLKLTQMQPQTNTIENTNDKQSEEAIKEIVKDYITATYGSIDNL